MFVRDLVAQSGWIWAKPDFIEDNEKVEKRVSWLNQLGILRQPIKYSEVADALDGLSVPQAMALLSELELQACVCFGGRLGWLLYNEATSTRVAVNSGGQLCADGFCSSGRSGGRCRVDRRR